VASRFGGYLLRWSRLVRPCASAASAVGHGTPNEPATSATLRHTSLTATAIARRHRPVVRQPDGTSPIASVNEPLAPSGSTQRQRRLCRTTEIPYPPSGRSRGVVRTYCFTDVDATPHEGQPAADLSAVSTCISNSYDFNDFNEVTGTS